MSFSQAQPKQRLWQRRRHHSFRSSSRRRETRSAVVWLLRWRDRAATSPACQTREVIFLPSASDFCIPIVFLTGGDPVALGLVDSLNRPGGNVTGVVSLSTELEPKKLELLQGVIPSSKIVGVLINDTNPFAQSQSVRLQQAAHALGLTVLIVSASIEDDFEAVF